MIEIKISTGNAAFCDPYSGEPNKYAEAKEVSRILSMIQTHLNHGYRSGTCIDYNGNKVGTWKFQ